ncbi:MAG: 50S ribosomal protein L18e [Nanoarchaeota archaeon]|nr:50S ribosomal protein L18e [Nanoarchaeota archaeon]
MKRGPTNIQLIKLINELKKLKKPIWKRVASDLERPRRIRRIVNLSRINRYTKDGDVVVVPGKVLGDGILEKKIEIAAFQFSQSAKEKIKLSGSSAISIQELIKKNPEGKGVKIIG